MLYFLKFSYYLLLFIYLFISELFYKSQTLTKNNDFNMDTVDNLFNYYVFSRGKNIVVYIVLEFRCMARVFPSEK